VTSATSIITTDRGHFTDNRDTHRDEIKSCRERIGKIEKRASYLEQLNDMDDVRSRCEFIIGQLGKLAGKQ